MPVIKPTLAVLTVLLLLTTACAGSDPTEEVVRGKQVRGQILEVVNRNLAEIELFTIRDAAGREYTFTTEGFVKFTPSHLKEHQLFGQTVLITYVEQEGRLVALEIDD